MLDEGEFRECFTDNSPDADVREFFESPRPRTMLKRHIRALQRYKQTTGVEERNLNTHLHHRISEVGAPCPTCGKPFRTPQARFCAACGFRPTDAHGE